MKAKLEEKKESLLKELGYQNDKGMESHLGEHYRKGFDAGISAYKEMLEGVGVERAKRISVIFYRGEGGPCELSSYGDPESSEMIEALPVLAKLQQQAEKITELESRLKEAEKCLEFYANKNNHTIRLASKEFTAMKEDLGKLARQYMEKVKNG